MKIERVVLVGGTGFVGRAIANRLAEAGINVVIPTRRRSRAGHVILLPNTEVVEMDVHDANALARLFASAGADAVVNLVGTLHSKPGTPYGPEFARNHVELPKKIVAACERSSVAQLVHISALGADAAGPSEYQRSKAAGEEAVRAARGVATTILRPSVIFGRDDRFLNLFAKLVCLFPVLPLAGAKTRFQPVHVEDVAEVVFRSLGNPAAVGQTFEVAGPTVYTLEQLVEYVAELTDHRNIIMPLPEAAALVQARLMELAPEPMMSRDNVRSMRVDNIAHGEPLPFGLTPTAVESIVPTYLGKGFLRARFYDMRTHTRHNRG